MGLKTFNSNSAEMSSLCVLLFNITVYNIVYDIMHDMSFSYSFPTKGKGTGQTIILYSTHLQMTLDQSV